MKRILIALLCFVLLCIAWLLLPEGRRHATLVVLKGCSSESVTPPSLPLFDKGEAALSGGDAATALACVEQGKREARDSDEYYRYDVLLAKYYFSAMKADSFMQCNRRLGQYLSGHQGESAMQRLLQVEYEMQLGAYEAKMVGRMDSALNHDLEALRLVDELGFDTSNRLVLLTNIADAYKQLGRYDEGVRYFRKAMELGDSLGMSDATRINVNIGIASAYAAMGDFDQSSIWWERARQLKPRMQRQELFQYLNNRGNDYYLQEKYQESLQCFLELDSMIARDPSMLWEKMYGHCNLSDVYIKLGQQEKARPLIDETERFFTQERQLLPLYYLTTQRIDLALIDGNLMLARQLVEQNPTPQWMIPEQRLLRERVLLKLYRQTANWQKYAQALQTVNQLQGAITDVNTRMRFQTALTQYEHEKQMLDKQRQLEEKELSFRWALSLFVASAIVIVLLLVIIMMKQRERKLEARNMRNRITGLRMETVRNRITPHFISNALTAEMLAQMDGKEVDLDPLVQLLHRGIELTGTEQTTLADELEFISFYCGIESRSIGPDFKYEARLAPNVDADHVLLPSMSVQILVENALKHGLKARPAQPGQQRSVMVRATRRDRGTLVEVIDNGVGLPEDRQIRERTGLKVVRQTIVMLNEQHEAEAHAAGDDNLMSYALENRTDGVQGCRGWIYLPDDFDYTLKTNNHGD
ncbi:MAG: tetratricopeptide repeat protein [Prevotella sp.]|nr:tetratricopeptide repeat protein [Prevotella sp.]